MQRRGTFKKYLLLLAVLFVLTSLPFIFVEKLRERAIATCSWIWKGKISRTDRFLDKQKETENHLLRLEIAKLRAQLEHTIQGKECRTDTEPNDDQKKYPSDFDLRNLHMQAICARVIYRDPANWSSCLWVDVGENKNQELKRQVLAKNSPVVIGNALIGVVDYVGKKQSRIRLITDSHLKPSVRVARGELAHTFLKEHIDIVLRHIDRVAVSQTDKDILTLKLEKARSSLHDSDTSYLAKGIVHGGSSPLWRGTHVVLKGIGFNYDFADSEGEPRDLRTGSRSGILGKNVPIIDVHDLLVTTGLDGVFPAGLHVAEVTKIYPMKEGAYTYDIEAIPVCGSFNALQILFILPPLSEESFDPPS